LGATDCRINAASPYRPWGPDVEHTPGYLRISTASFGLSMAKHVEQMVRIAKELRRAVATCEEAPKIM